MLMVNALAGTGKTSTGTWGLGARVPRGVKVSDEQKAIIKLMREYKGTQAAMAFNRSIADKLAEEAPATCVCNTSNGFGHRVWAGHLQTSKLNVDGLKNRKLCRELIGNSLPWKERMKVESSVDSLVSLCKCYLFDPCTSERENWLGGDVWVDGLGAMRWLCDRFDIESDISVLDYTCRTFTKGLTTGAYIDFDDQNFMPIYHNVKMSTYDHVLVDECLPAHTPVMMADGSSKRIDEIVEGDMVRSLDTITFKACNRKVTACQRIINKKKSVKVTVLHNHRTGTNYKRNFVVCTEDHKIWTRERGWVESGKLLVGDTVVIETAAKTTQVGKITKKGSKKLANLLKGNTRGIGNAGGVISNKIRGGNGRPLPKEQVTLLNELGDGWESEYSVLTGRRPTCYKVDIANPELKIAIEVDGNSHSSRKEEDKRKTDFLEIMGWKVFRFTNKQIRQELPYVLQTICPDGANCPMFATVTSVEEALVDDIYVYDISVEDTHCFYANGILVHNCQDLNRAKQEMAFRMARQITAVGDKHQAIYGFSGADSDAMANMWKRMQEVDSEAQSLPLTITRRNPRKVVERANRWVPELRARDDAPDGIVETMKMDQFHKVVGNEPSMVICRINAPLSSLAFKLLAQGKRCYIQGRDIGSGLKSEIKKTGENDLRSALIKVHDRIERRKIEISQRDFPDENQIEALSDKLMCIDILASNVDTIEEFNKTVDDLFKDKGNDKTDTRLSSVHKAKGLEHPKVYVYMSNRLGLKAKKAYQTEQEKNLAYVADTRSMSELYLIPEEKKEKVYDE